jgi:hypothetical protein
MATLTLPKTPPAVGPSDADLLNTTASLLSAMPGPRLSQPLSDVIEYVCSISAPEGRPRAQQLVLLLARHLHAGMALRADEVSRDGLDAWAAKVSLPVVRTRMVGCARCQRAGGDVR